MREVSPWSPRYAERLNAWLHMQPEGTFLDGSMVDWSMGSHPIANERVYMLAGNRKLGRTIITPRCPWSLSNEPKLVSGLKSPERGFREEVGGAESFDTTGVT